MYNSLKTWMTIPVAIKPFLKKSGTGTKLYDVPVDTLCYAMAEVKTVTNEAGVEVISNTQIYLDGSTQVNSNDNLIFEGKERGILSIERFYNGSGVISMKVVYL